MNKELNEWIDQHKETSNLPELSIIIPAYNEEFRLPPNLINIIDYFDAKKIFYEVIIVDDGSKDNTSKFVKKISRICPQVKLIILPRNYGKGHAVRTGMLNANGKMMLLADADGATPINEFAKLEKAINECSDIALGSRAIHSEETSVKAHLLRKVMGRIFNFFVKNILLSGFADTQCGFKLFTCPVAKFLFSHQTANQFSFDIEILYIAKKAGLKISEIPINWSNVTGSKVNIVTDSIKMFIDIFRFRIMHNSVTPDDYLSFNNPSIEI